MAREEYVYGHHLMFEEDAVDGYRYLDNRLDSDCAKVFFVHAQHYKTAVFEDHQGKKYVLTYNGNDKYTLEKK